MLQPFQRLGPLYASNTVGLCVIVGPGVVGFGEGKEVGDDVGGLLASNRVVGRGESVGEKVIVGCIVLVGIDEGYKDNEGVAVGFE